MAQIAFRGRSRKILLPLHLRRRNHKCVAAPWFFDLINGGFSSQYFLRSILDSGERCRLNSGHSAELQGGYVDSVFRLLKCE